jgi:hypothetical protein
MQKVGREDILKHKIGKLLGQSWKLSHLKKNLSAKSIFPHRNIYKCTWTSPGGKTIRLIPKS